MLAIGDEIVKRSAMAILLCNIMSIIKIKNRYDFIMKEQQFSLNTRNYKRQQFKANPKNIFRNDLSFL